LVTVSEQLHDELRFDECVFGYLEFRAIGILVNAVPIGTADAEKRVPGEWCTFRLCEVALVSLNDCGF
jgi:hypothetical protein